MILKSSLYKFLECGCG